MLYPAAVALLAAAAQPTAPPLEEVVVTARRREERLAEVAASITRLAPGVTGRLEITHAADALNRVPGVLQQRGSGQESLLAIRSPVLTGAGACGAFLLLEDGFPLRPTGFCNINELFESNTSQAAAIEVMRGPGGGVYGANAVHGVINVLTPAVVDLAGWRVGLTGGDDGFAALAVAAGAEGLGAQALRRRDDGFRDDSAVAEYKLNLLHDRPLRGGQLRWRFAATQLDQDTAGFIRGFDSYRDPLLRRSNPNPEAFRDASSQRLSAAWTRNSCPDCDDEIRGIVRNSSMTFLQHFLLGKPLERNGQHSVALALARSRPLSAESLVWRLGLDAEWADTSLQQSQTGATLEGSAAARAIRPSGRHYDYAVNVAAFGASAALERRRDAWSWRLSLRADQVAYEYDNRMRDGNTAEDGSLCPGGCLYNRPADRRDDYSHLTPRFELVRRLGNGDRLYAVLAEGFRPPEITELYRLQRNQSPTGLRAETLRSAEIGWRFGLETPLRGSLALYRARKSDVILRDANGFSLTGGRTRHEGFEYELVWALPAARDRDGGLWEVSAGGSLARHRYDFSRVIEGGETIIAGRDIDTAPRALHRLSLAWRLQTAVALELEARYAGSHFADAANERRHPSQTTLALRGRWQTNGRLALTLEVDNLADRLHADRADFAQGDWRYFPARRRTGWLGFDWRSR
jgi:outer membrane receptor protein involved in Fe transport